MLKFCFEYPKKIEKAINRRQVDGGGWGRRPPPLKPRTIIKALLHQNKHFHNLKIGLTPKNQSKKAASKSKTCF